jgi:nucleoside-diphosphate-sugar epimerase
MARLAAVTGATGFLGRYIAGALAASGWRVRILARRPPDHPQLDDLELETVSGDLSDGHALRRLIDGADVVIHAAALIKARSAATFRAVNVDGTANLARALNDSRRASRVVLVSSMAAREPQLSAYAQTKRMSEEVLTSLIDARHAWTIVRPCAIYGPWDRETLGIFRAVVRGIAPRVPAANARIALLHAADGARAIAAICERGCAGAILELTDERPEGYAWEEIISAAERALRVKATAIRVPGAALRTAAAFNFVTAWALGRIPMLTPGKAREILHADWGSRADRQPPREWWRPEIGLEQGFRETVSWYRDRHWLSSAPPRLAARGALH